MSKLMELLDNDVNITVGDIIHLFLLGYDDKVYLNLRTQSEYILSHERIIRESWYPYYESKVLYIEEIGFDERGVFTIVI